MTPYLIVYSGLFSSFNSDWIRPLCDGLIRFEPWQPDRSYSAGTGFYINCLDLAHSTVDALCNQGFRVIVDNLWESQTPVVPGVHTVSNPRWFWYNESLWYRHMGYDQYQPRFDPQYLALMLIRRNYAWRRDFVRALGDLTDRMLWSSVEQGQQLPWDRDITHRDTQRYFDPRWYDLTGISMVLESSVATPLPGRPVFVTEKTMKPLAFQHPFMVMGQPGVLATLRHWGFETFSNLWDESYDTVLRLDQRRSGIVELLRSVQLCRDSETQRRIQHNRDRFFDSHLVHTKIRQEIIEPILEYAEKT